MANHNIHRVLIDIGSLMDVLFRLTYNQMELSPALFKLTDTPLYGFTSYSMQPYVGVELFITTSNLLA